MDLKELKKLINEELNKVKERDLSPDEKTTTDRVGKPKQQVVAKQPLMITDPDTQEELPAAFDEEGFPVDTEDYSKQEDYTKQINQLLDQPGFVKYLLADPRVSQLFREKFRSEKK